jgi:hypothetical protein
MEGQGARDDGSGRSKPIGTFSGAATPDDATGVGEPIEVGFGAGEAATGGMGGASQPQDQQTGAASMAEGAKTKVDAGLDMAAGGIDKLVDAIRDRGDGLGQSSGAAGTVGSVATAAADKLEGASQYLHQTDTERLMTDLEALVRRKPVESLLVAAGVGFVLAKALR